MPALLRGILIIAAIAIVFYVVWVLTTLASTTAR
jgi:hypothetical protein